MQIQAHNCHRRRYTFIIAFESNKPRNARNQLKVFQKSTTQTLMAIVHLGTSFSRNFQFSPRETIVRRRQYVTSIFLFLHYREWRVCVGAFVSPVRCAMTSVYTENRHTKPADERKI